MMKVECPACHLWVEVPQGAEDPMHSEQMREHRKWVCNMPFLAITDRDIFAIRSKDVERWWPPDPLTEGDTYGTFEKKQGAICP